MKPWYQYRCEEAGFDSTSQSLNEVMFFKHVCERLRKFMFIQFHFGGIHWEFKAGWTDWRAIIGHS